MKPSKLELPTIHLPNLDLPAINLSGAEIAEAAERWKNAMAPLIEVGERFRAHIESINETINKTLAPLANQLRWVGEQTRQCEVLEKAGWLPHNSSPLHLIEASDGEQGDLGVLVEAYYRDEWDSVSSSLVAQINACKFDQEAKECFSEAVAAHGAGLYRCAPRLLFPEIERVARIELHGGALDKIASQDKLIEAISGLTPAEMSDTGVAGLRFYKKLTEHLYLHLKDADRVAIAFADPVPNRHAAVHGIVPYTSAKSSLNAILVADYLLQAISTLKRLAREDDEARSTSLPASITPPTATRTAPRTVPR